jgi:hypothetical protein
MRNSSKHKLAPGNANGMLVELRGRAARRDRFLFVFQATVPTRQDVQR